MSTVTLNAVSKAYNGVEAVKSLSIEIANGELVALLGPPGAGKSSTVKMIAGVEDVSEGEIFFDGKAVHDLPPNRRDVAMVFDSYALYPHLTAFENIAYPLREQRQALGLSNAQIEEEVNQIADLLQFREHLERKPAHLSGGQKQRVALGRALVRRPGVLLLDEPIAHLDARLRHHLRGELKRLHRERGVTTIYSTPDYLEAIAVADRIAVLFDGELHQFTTPAEILNAPATARVAEFVGDPPMNIFPAKVTGEGTQLSFNCEVIGVSLPVPEHLQAQVTADAFPDGVLVGFRPGDIVIGEQDKETTFTAEVYIVERLHRKSIVSVEKCGVLLKVNAPNDYSAAVGMPVNVHFNADKIHVFDARTLQAVR